MDIRVFSRTRFRTTPSLSGTQNHNSCTLLNPCGMKTVRKGARENTLLCPTKNTLISHQSDGAKQNNSGSNLSGSVRILCLILFNFQFRVAAQLFSN